MKRVAVLMVIAVLSLTPLVVSAQTSAKPNMFSTIAACKAALESGNFRFYEPKYFGLKTKNPPNQGDRIAVPLETDLCLEMLVVGGRRFVIQREGTLFRAHKLTDGSLSLYARDDCGNPVYGVVFPAPVVPVTVIEREPEPEPARLRLPREVSPPPIEPVDRVVYRERDKRGGFCSSTKCRLAVLALAGGAGYGAYYYWPCPPGSSRR